MYPVYMYLQYFRKKNIEKIYITLFLVYWYIFAIKKLHCNCLTATAISE